MYSWLVTVLLLASAPNSRGQGAVGEGAGGGCASWPVTNRTGLHL